MLGSLLGIMLLLGHRGKEIFKSSGGLSVSGLTDNLGNRFILSRLLTTKWPLMAFLAEMAAQLEHLGILFEMNWVPREQNAEADAITNDQIEWLNPIHRASAELSSLPFLVLPDLLSKGEVFYENIENVNEGASGDSKDKHLSLRVREPWD